MGGVIEQLLGRRTPLEDGLGVRELAAKAVAAPGNVSKLLRTLERAGAVERSLAIICNDLRGAVQFDG